MSVISGILGASAQESAAEAGAQVQRETTSEQMALARELARAVETSQGPYSMTGYQALADLYGKEIKYKNPFTGVYEIAKPSGSAFDFAINPMTGKKYELPDFQRDYESKLGDYKQSEGYLAQNALGQKALARQLQARGLGSSATAANASAELSQRLIATDFDKFRAEKAAGYQDLMDKLNFGRKLSGDIYHQKTDPFKLAQNAAGMVTNAQTGSTNMQSGALGELSKGLAASYGNQGAAEAGMYKSIGSGIPTAIRGAKEVYDWWNKPQSYPYSTPAYSSGAAATGVNATTGSSVYGDMASLK